jgi:hypothetical protein
MLTQMSDADWGPPHAPGKRASIIAGPATAGYASRPTCPRHERGAARFRALARERDNRRDQGSAFGNRLRSTSGLRNSKRLQPQPWRRRQPGSLIHLGRLTGENRHKPVCVRTRETGHGLTPIGHDWAPRARMPLRWGPKRERLNRARTQ